jgi:HD-like signal output (HDOD) protein
MQIQSLIDQPSKLPTVPKVTQQLIESFSSEDSTSHEIAETISADPALSAKLLRLANSAYFHVSRTIGTVEDALHMLGFVMVRNLVLGNGMVAAFRNIPGLDLQQFWRYNLNTACASRWLAMRADLNGDVAFTLGLLHAIGELQMHAVASAEMRPLDKKLSVLDAGRAKLESEVLGFHYGQVSAELAKIWNFPLELIEALRHVPDPLAAAELSRPAAVVHLGAWRARVDALQCSDEAIVASYPADVARRLGLPWSWAQLSTDADGQGMPELKELTIGLDAMLE